jgi:hypothetical protein
MTRWRCARRPCSASSGYARAGLDDYWIVNLVDRVLEVYRQPITDASAAFGRRYGSRQTRDAESAVAPLAAPGVSVRVSDLLP